MKQNRLFKLLGTAAALLVLMFLVSKSLAINFEQHQLYRSTISNQLEDDAAINQNVLKARYALLISYDPLVRAVVDQAALQTELENIPDFVGSSGSQAIQLLLTQNKEVFERKEALVERFKSQNALLKNSLTYLPTLFQELRTSGILNATLETLLDNVLIYSLASDEELVPTINAQIGQLEQQLQANPSPSNTGIKLAIDHTRVILENKSEVDQLTKDIPQAADH